MTRIKLSRGTKNPSGNDKKDVNGFYQNNNYRKKWADKQNERDDEGGSESERIYPELSIENGFP